MNSNPFNLENETKGTRSRNEVRALPYWATYRGRPIPGSSWLARRPSPLELDTQTGFLGCESIPLGSSSFVGLRHPTEIETEVPIETYQRSQWVPQSSTSVGFFILCPIDGLVSGSTTPLLWSVELSLDDSAGLLNAINKPHKRLVARCFDQ